jgi:hypothetical protein
MGSAEKLWSPAALTNGSFFGTRQEVFADHRCVLVRRGLPVQPTSAYSWSCPFVRSAAGAESARRGRLLT